MDMYFCHINLKESIHTHDFLRLYLRQAYAQNKVHASCFSIACEGKSVYGRRAWPHLLV